MNMSRDDNQPLATIDDRRHPMHQTRAIRTAATRLAGPVGYLPITANRPSPTSHHRPWRS